jgi:hypothetical protein
MLSSSYDSCEFERHIGMLCYHHLYPSQRKDFGTMNKRGNPDVRSNFRGCEYSIWAKNHWKAVRKIGFPLLFIVPKSSFGEHNLVSSTDTLSCYHHHRMTRVSSNDTSACYHHRMTRVIIILWVQQTHYHAIIIVRLVWVRMAHRHVSRLAHMPL